MIIRLSPGDRWFVYLLEDNTGTAFYVGQTQNPYLRAAAHRTKTGPIKDRIAEIEATGGFARMRVLADFATRDLALWREGAEMRRRPGLLNEAGYRGAYRNSKANLAARAFAPISRVISSSAASLDEGAEK